MKKRILFVVYTVVIVSCVFWIGKITGRLEYSIMIENRSAYDLQFLWKKFPVTCAELEEMRSNKERFSVRILDNVFKVPIARMVSIPNESEPWNYILLFMKPDQQQLADSDELDCFEFTE